MLTLRREIVLHMSQAARALGRKGKGHGVEVRDVHLE